MLEMIKKGKIKTSRKYRVLSTLVTALHFIHYTDNDRKNNSNYFYISNGNNQGCLILSKFLKDIQICVSLLVYKCRGCILQKTCVFP